jgi:protoheme IX farnesyltransferase
MIARTTTMPAAIRDLFALTKPRLSLLVIITCGGAMALAPGALSPLRALVTLLGATMVVGAANALNCYLERDLDGYMRRTRTRPLPAGRLTPRAALVLAFVLSVLSIPALTFAANPLTALLGTIGLATYVLVYTPMKQRSSLALWVGAVPGAIPPLMGWTAVRNAIEVPGLVLFAVLFCWQIPHFIAIAVNAREDYARAGHKTLPLQVSPLTVQLHATAWTTLLLPVSLLLVPLGVAGVGYLVTAAVLGLVFLGYTASGFFRENQQRWALQTFRASLAYLTLLFVALSIDAR